MKEIEVFILTKNRIDLLKYSINSILNQTHKVKLTIIDNNSDDLTEVYVKDLMKHHDNVFYYKQNSTVEFCKNLETAQKLAKTEYVMFFHDDDILHPQYLEIAYRLINKYDDVDIICGLLTTFKDNSEINFEKHNTIKYSIFKDKIAFTKHSYSACITDNTSIMFPHVIYKTNNIKNITIESNKYGKIADKPFVINSIKSGKCIQIRNKDMLMYRIHCRQDSANNANGPYLNEIINHNKFFKELLSKNFFTRLRFNVFAILWLKFLFEFGAFGDVSNKQQIKEFVKNAYNQGAINKYTYNLYFNKIRFLYKFIQKMLVNYYKHQDKRLKEYTLVLEDVK